MSTFNKRIKSNHLIYLHFKHPKVFFTGKEPARLLSLRSNVFKVLVSKTPEAPVIIIPFKAVLVNVQRIIEL